MIKVGRFEIATEELLGSGGYGKVVAPSPSLSADGRRQLALTAASLPQFFRRRNATATHASLDLHSPPLQVVAARDSKSGERVAAKLVDARKMRKEAVQHEVGLLEMLKHPHIVGLRGFEAVSRGDCVIFMELAAHGARHFRDTYRAVSPTPLATLFSPPAHVSTSNPRRLFATPERQRPCRRGMPSAPSCPHRRVVSHAASRGVHCWHSFRPPPHTGELFSRVLQQGPLTQRHPPHLRRPLPAPRHMGSA